MGEFIDTSIRYNEIPQGELFKDCSINQNNVYHYTSMSGLKGIVENDSLWFTDINYMNDMEEVKAGIDHAYTLIDSFPENLKDKTKAALDDILESKNRVFVACFSLERDFLGLWNYYTKNTTHSGINISFDYKNLVESILRKNKELDRCFISCGIVDYSPQYENSYIDISMKNVDVAISSFLKENIPYNNIPVFTYDGHEKCFRYKLFSEIYYYIKRECFKHEKEFRIVIEIPEQQVNNIVQSSLYKFREGNDVLIPFLNIKFDLSSIHGITIAPTMRSDLIDKSLKNFLEYKKVDTSLFTDGIKKSSIPVRY